jgi:ribosomal protein S18 acetylase RimI-like enzyme
MSVVVRQVRESECEAWRALYDGYAGFYETGVDDAHLDRLWQRIIEERSVECFVAEVDGRLLGLAHVREFVRPLDGSVGGYLDDLYVEPAGRGNGIGAALLEHLRGLAAERGWSVVRWITAADNVTAQRLYDRVATRTPWVTYDMAPA